MRNVASFGGALTAVVLSVGSAAGATGAPAGDGGTFRVGVNGDFFVAIDPALAGPAAQVFLQATCAGLMRTPDEPLPTGLSLVPEIATGYPKITNHGKTYTFTIRKGVRFSNGAPVTSRSFAYTINRLLSPQLQAAGADPYYKVIVGAQAVVEGNAKAASGIRASGSTLTIKLKRPAGNFLSYMAAGAGPSCVVPETVGIDPEGAQAPLPSAGPYYISEYASASGFRWSGTASTRAHAHITSIASSAT